MEAEAPVVDQVSPAEFARRIQVSLSAVSNAISTGRLRDSVSRLANGRWLIDFEKGRKEFVENKLRRAVNTDAPGSRHGGGSGEDTIEKAELKLKQARAELAELELAREEGKLVDAEEIEEEWGHVAALVKTKLLGVPAKARNQIPDLTTDQYLVFERLIREALEDLADEER